MKEIATPSQTVGPFFHIGLEHIAVSNLAAGVPGEKIEIMGRVLDGDRQPVIDALVEIWQANSLGKYAPAEDIQSKPLQANFTGYGRIATGANGAFRFTTIKPGPVQEGDSNSQAPHIAVNVFMRGLLKHLVTRIYFPDEPSNHNDPILNSVPVERRSTLVAQIAGSDPTLLTWDVVLQGKHETVFFDC